MTLSALTMSDSCSYLRYIIYYTHLGQLYALSDYNSFEVEMSAEVYDEIEIEDLDFDPDNQTFYYPCPCGDKFNITL